MEPQDFDQSLLWLRQNVFFIRLDERSVVVDTNQRMHYTPNHSAAFLLDLLVNPNGVHFQNLKRALMQEYQLAEAEARVALNAALNDFSSKNILGQQVVQNYDELDLLALREKDFAALGEPLPPPALEGWAEAQLVQGGTFVSFGRVPFVKNVYVG